jgi:hypothetical protein
MCDKAVQADAPDELNLAGGGPPDAGQAALLHQWMQFPRDALVRECEARGLPKSGTKTELSQRMMAYQPGEGEPVTEPQLRYLRDLEGKTQQRAAPQAFRLKSAASKEISRLSALLTTSGRRT